MLESVGFADIEIAQVDRTGESPSAMEAATGLIDGNPIASVIRERRPDALGEIKAPDREPHRGRARRPTGSRSVAGHRLLRAEVDAVSARAARWCPRRPPRAGRTP